VVTHRIETYLYLGGTREMTMQTQPLGDLELLRADIEAMQLVLRALIDSHPAPPDLVNHWRRDSFDARERARPKSGHVGFQSHNDVLHQRPNHWSALIHAIESADSKALPDAS
jgi:hypothetical protein